MANNYCETSSWMDIPEEHMEMAEKIADSIAEEMEKDDAEGYCGIEFEFRNDVTGCGVWFKGDESANVEHLAEIAQAIVDTLMIDKPFCFSWSYGCSKPRLDEFGGGACTIQRGKDQYWVGSMELAEKHARKAKEPNKRTLTIEVEFDPDMSDIDSVASAMDTLMKTALSTPGIMDEYGNPKIGEFYVQK